MQAFILRRNIVRFRELLQQEEEEHARHTLQVLLAKASRELAILEAGREGLSVETDLVSATSQRLIFRDEFASSKQPYLLLDPRKGLHIVDINDAYGNATMTSAAKIAGNPMFDVFPDNPADEMADGVSNLFGSLRRASERGVADVMAIQRYDVRDSNGVFVTKFWKPINRPIFDDKGKLVYLLHHVEDVTAEMNNIMKESPRRSSDDD